MAASTAHALHVLLESIRTPQTPLRGVVTTAQAVVDTTAPQDLPRRYDRDNFTKLVHFAMERAPTSLTHCGSVCRLCAQQGTIAPQTPTSRHVQLGSTALTRGKLGLPRARTALVPQQARQHASRPL